MYIKCFCCLKFTVRANRCGESATYNRYAIRPLKHAETILEIARTVLGDELLHPINGQLALTVPVCDECLTTTWQGEILHRLTHVYLDGAETEEEQVSRRALVSEMMQSLSEVQQ